MLVIMVGLTWINRMHFMINVEYKLSISHICSAQGQFHVTKNNRTHPRTPETDIQLLLVGLGKVLIAIQQ